MRIMFEFYGILEQLARTVEYTIEIDAPVSLADALALLTTCKPEITQQLERCACAIGDKIVHRDKEISEDTLVALLPPVAGG